MDRFAHVMDDLLTHLGLESANVLGLSLGGMIAQELAHRSPERVEKLVLASTAPGRTVNPMAMAILASRARSYSRRRSERVSFIGHGKRYGADPSLLRQQWDLRGYRPSGRGFLLQFRAAMSWSSRPWLDELEMPVLAIVGSDDLVVGVGPSRRIAAKVRDGRLEIIPGGGHLCVLKEPDMVARLIRDFVHDC